MQRVIAQQHENSRRGGKLELKMVLNLRRMRGRAQGTMKEQGSKVRSGTTHDFSAFSEKLLFTPYNRLCDKLSDEHFR